MPKKAKKKRSASKNIDHQLEMSQCMAEASISLGAALYHARKLGKEDVALRILKMAKASERIESNLLGKKIDRLQEGL